MQPRFVYDAQYYSPYLTLYLKIGDRYVVDDETLREMISRLNSVETQAVAAEIAEDLASNFSLARREGMLCPLSTGDAISLFLPPGVRRPRNRQEAVELAAYCAMQGLYVARHRIELELRDRAEGTRGF